MSESFSIAPNRAVAGLSFSVCNDPAQIADQWLEFEKIAQATVFQSYKWTSAWCRTSAMAFGERPLIVTGYDSTGRLALVWPMAIVRKLGVSVLSWLCQDRSCYNSGLYRHDIIEQLGGEEIRAILDQIACQRPEISAINFLKQPFEFNGVKNPLARLPVYLAANPAYALDLSPDFDSLYASIFGARSRNKHRQKVRYLAKAGELKFVRAETEGERFEVLETFLRQKALQFQNQGMPNKFADPRMQMFYRELARETGDGFPLECTSLRVGDTVAATRLGIQFQNSFYSLNISMDLGELKRWSPGFILLREQIARHCGQGTIVFDFGPGPSEIKDSWHAYERPVFETHLALDPRGWTTTVLSQTKARSKLAIKRSPIFWKIGQSVRGLVKAFRRSTISRPHSS